MPLILDFEDSSRPRLIWKVNDKPLDSQLVVEDRISALYASGAELQTIRNRFTGIPMTTNDEVVWRDAATIAFIVDNLSF